MAHLVYWMVLIVAISVLFITERIERVNFLDFIVCMLAAILALSFDLIISAQYKLYAYVDRDFTCLYSAIYGIFLYPSIGLIFTKFLYKIRTKLAAFLYIFIWFGASTIVEIILIPTKMVVYTGWKIFPWSVVVYVLTYTFLYRFYIVVRKHVKQ